VITPRNIVVATDFGDAAGRALQYGLEFARAFGSRLHIVHVADDFAGRVISGVGMPPVDTTAAQRVADAEARTMLGTLVTDDRMREVDARPILLHDHDTARGLLDYVRSSEADLVIIGTHGHGGLAEFFLGSVAQRIVRSAACPVLTVRADEREFVSPEPVGPAGRPH
jgi:nucleotide-binding universal stress UspA family protein